MSYHILHLLSHNLRVRLKLDQLQITDTEKGTERTVPLADVAVIVAAAPDLSVTAGALRRMAELNVLLLICNEKFEPCCLTLPYYRPTSTGLLRRQVEWTAKWKEAVWRQIVVAKIRNQAEVVGSNDGARGLLSGIADRCEHPKRSKARAGPRVSLDKVTASRRPALLSDAPGACESQAARHYWKCFFASVNGKETKRKPGTRAGVNGMLDYGYAVARTAVLRSLAAHGFIAAIGINHAAKAGSFALADDLMEPLRPFVDRALREFLSGGERSMKEWIPHIVKILAAEVRMGKVKVRLLNAIDLYVQSFASAVLARSPLRLRIPMLK